MSLAVLADHMASKGRNGDTMLVHMAPEEVAGLHALALSHGGYMTINPETGLPEAFSLKGLLKSALPMIAGFALGPAGFGIVSSALGAGALVGGATALATGSLQKGLMAGLGAYGGASLGSALVGGSSAGASTAAAEAAKAAGEQLVRDNAMAASVGADLVTGSAADKFVQDAATKAYSDFAAKPLLEQATGSFNALKNAPGATGMFGGLGALAKPALMAAAPIMADAMVQTATPMPTGQRYQGTIRPYKFDPYTKRWTAQPTYPAVPVNTAAEPNPQEQQPPGGYNTGGIVALAAGGAPNMKEFMDKTGADAQTASDLLYGVVGSNKDTRDWNSIFAAQDPLAAARQATANMYGGVSSRQMTDPATQQQYNQLFGGSGVNLTGAGTYRDVNFGVGLTPTQEYLLNQQAAASPAATQTSAAPQRTGSVAEQNVLNTKGWQSRSGLTGIEGLNSNINMWFNEFPQAGESDIRSAMQQYGLNDADIMRATGKTVGELAYKPFVDTMPRVVGTVPGTTGTPVEFGGDTVIPEYTAPVTTPTLGEAFQPTPQTMEQVRTNYEQGGGSTAMPTVTTLRPGERPMTQNAVVDKLQAYLDANPNATAGEIMTWGRNNAVPEYQLRAAINERRFSMLTGGSKNAYDYLMGRGEYPATPFVPGGGPLMRPYSEVVGGTQSAMSRFRPTMPPSSGERGSTTSTTQTTKTTTPSVDTLRTSFDQSIFGKTPEEKAAYYNTLLGQGYTDEQIRAAINAPLDDNWLALRAIAERLRGGKTGGATTSSAVTGGGTTTTGGGITLLGGSNTTASNTGTGVDTTRSTDASTVGGVVVGNNVIDPISGGVLGVVTTNVDQGTGGIIQGDVIVDPISGKIIGYTDDAGLVGRLVNKNIGEEPAIIESRDIGGGNAGYDYDVGAGYYDDAANRDRSFYYDYAAPSRSFDDMSPFAQGGLADVAAMSAARGGNVRGYNLGGYSDGGRLLRGPGDGVSDSIPATIGNKQPARLADGEFVIPARIVSEIGNGSTEAGARKLYAMMDRVQRARAKTTGKGKVAKNTRAEKYLPA